MCAFHAAKYYAKFLTFFEIFVFIKLDIYIFGSSRGFLKYLFLFQ